MKITKRIQRSMAGKASIAAAAAVLMLSGIVSANADVPAGYHVTICHRTGSASNPYIVISPDVEGVIEGHLDHEQTGVDHLIDEPLDLADLARQLAQHVARAVVVDGEGGVASAGRLAHDERPPVGGDDRAVGEQQVLGAGRASAAGPSVTHR